MQEYRQNPVDAPVTPERPAAEPDRTARRNRPGRGRGTPIRGLLAGGLVIAVVSLSLVAVLGGAPDPIAAPVARTAALVSGGPGTGQGPHGTATDTDAEAGTDGAVPARTVAWLDRMNRQALGRDMDPEGTRYWAARLAAGAPRVEVTDHLVNSETWRRYRVAEAYQRWLGTTPDVATVERWQRWLASNPTSELDIRLASSADGRTAAGTTNAERAQHLADALNLPAAAPHFAKQLGDGAPWGAVVREGYLSHPASDRRMLDLAPASAYTPTLTAQVEAFRSSGDERVPLARALATLA